MYETVNLIVLASPSILSKFYAKLKLQIQSVWLESGILLDC
jgi:hypothetical protein